MDLADWWKVAASTFGVVFVAELGDKTQLATMLLAADKPGARWAVFAGSAVALVLAAGIGVAAGSMLTQYIPEKTLKVVASIGFIGMGCWLLRGALTAS